MTCRSFVAMFAAVGLMGLLDIAIGDLVGTVGENLTQYVNEDDPDHPYQKDANDTLLDKAKAMAHETGDLTSLECSFQSFPRDHTIQATAIAAGSSIYPSYATNEEMNWGVDMAGLWWMMGNQLAEEFVSWKGATSDSPNSFPMEMRAPTNLGGNWVWPSSIKGRVLMSYYALTEDPTVPQVAQWTNASYAVIVPIAGGSSDSGFQYVLRRDESDPTGDTWIRENLDSPEDTEPEYIYTLVRVVNGNGTANARWWPEFETYADGLGITDLQIWGNDNACMRACETLNVCSVCKWWCGDDDISRARGAEKHAVYLLLLAMWYGMAW